MKSRTIVLLIALGILMGLAPSRGENADYLSAFETVWKIVDETYFDPAFGGLNWKGVHDRYRPQIAAAGKDEEFYGLVNKMLWELKVSHANFVPPGSLALYEPLVFAEGNPGLDFRFINGAAVVTSVKQGSPAYEAGLRPGYVIQAIDGIAVEKIVQDAERVNPPPSNSRSRIARSTKRILGRIYGPFGHGFPRFLGRRREEKARRRSRAKRAGLLWGRSLWPLTLRRGAWTAGSDTSA
jgi:C-terminal processing protease CtpA/Prc